MTQRLKGVLAGVANIITFFFSSQKLEYKLFTFNLSILTVLPFLRRISLSLFKTRLMHNWLPHFWRWGLLHGTIRSCSQDDRLFFIKNVFYPELEKCDVFEEFKELCDKLLTDGYLRLEGVFSTEDIKKINSELDGLTRKSGQVWSQGTAMRKKSGFFCWDPQQVISNSVINGYLGKVPFLSLISKLKSPKFSFYSLNPYGAFANARNHYVQKFHRDYDGFLSFSAMILLTDSDEKNGATELLINEASKDIQKQNVFRQGNAGDVLIFDTFSLHRANSYLENERRLMWLRFGEFPNGGVAQDIGWKISKILKAI
jgi:hypothetical protein